MKNEKERKIDKARKDWEKKQKKQKVAYEYFGKALEEICDDNTILPRFFNKCLEHIELVGMSFLICIILVLAKVQRSSSLHVLLHTFMK